MQLLLHQLLNGSVALNYTRYTIPIHLPRWLSNLNWENKEQKNWTSYIDSSGTLISFRDRNIGAYNSDIIWSTHIANFPCQVLHQNHRNDSTASSRFSSFNNIKSITYKKRLYWYFKITLNQVPQKRTHTYGQGNKNKCRCRYNDSCLLKKLWGFYVEANK